MRYEPFIQRNDNNYETNFFHTIIVSLWLILIRNNASNDPYMQMKLIYFITLSPSICENFCPKYFGKNKDKDVWKEWETYMLILEGTFSDEMTTTGMSFQEDEDPCMCKQDFCFSHPIKY